MTKARTETGAPEAIRCPQCHVELGPAGLLGRCHVSWPNQRWAYFECSACGFGSHIEFEADRLSFGTLDGAPGPAFFPSASFSVPGLRTSHGGGGLVVRWPGHRFTIPEKS